MRIANIDGRAALVIGDEGAERGVDLARASHGRFGPDLPAVYQAWDDVTGWVAGQDLAVLADDGFPIDRSLLGAPSPAPRQVFAVGLNYHAHAAESGFESPTHLPPVFTKYASSFTGPDTDVIIPAGGNVDWEVELVAVIGREASGIDDADAWAHVAGLTVGQDISERVSQLRGPAPQFGLGKSFAGFSPQGPWLVTPDEFANPDDLELGCTIDGDQVQKGRTRDLIFPVSKLIAALSRTVTLYPGDVIFTGTPAGVGVGRDPQRFLQAGEKLDSWIEGIGQLHQRFVADPYAK
ncbi:MULTISPECIES: fumarylacetoacetate hydrolase family protein [unclassified Rhodococcus (in: high G+C Gram-positive bacteria)]|uniref:fumarylacetoacetate hydrolase family protein n=1 Tax=unclassified Rhodococcus (in: high G+C Gram-positive bacteria) TaxID=192944 RepID=UPI001639BAF6|nr:MULTISPECIES: fumarylacetoacetate hydrolase family protein [unclassified Rhodococcus (in: high G+C Gram-positive bacteria)]MBC2640894.1 fumarylacetoacetate hydrolase family protein [Rhodococcus sp. 3A]MBC2894362.1 fumarylacetoacetate hydrolase family protein [Rhodococcus sp. 4CII]